MITLHDAVDDVTIELPDDLFWVDEFEWDKIAQAQEYLVGGSLLIEESEKLAGRTITLAGMPDMGWVPRSTVLALQARRDLPGRQFTLTLKDSRQFTVVFNRASGAVEAEPVLPWKQTETGDWYSLTLRFTEV